MAPPAGMADGRAARLWHEVRWVLEVDDKAMTELFLLAHLGERGRSEANEILWNLLADWGLQQDYRDLSNLVTNQVHGARAGVERPPRHHRDRGTWSWQKYLEPRNKVFSPILSASQRSRCPSS